MVNYFFWSIVIGAFLGGLSLVPLGMAIAGPSLTRGLRGVIGRVQWTIGALAMGAYTLYERADGRPEIRDANAETSEMHIEDTWVELTDLAHEDIEIDGTPTRIEMVDTDTLDLETPVDLDDPVLLTRLRRRWWAFLRANSARDAPEPREWPRETIHHDDLVGYEIAVGDQRFTVSEVSGARLHATDRWRSVEGSEWSMLGKTPFAVSYEDDPAAFDELAAPETELASGSGQARLLDRERAGTHLVAAADRSAGIVVDKFRALDRWRDAAGISIAAEAKKQALKDHGGDKGSLSNRQLIVGIIACMLFGAIFGYLSFFL